MKHGTANYNGFCDDVLEMQFETNKILTKSSTQVLNLKIEEI